MPAAVKMWEIVDDSLHPVTNDSFASGHFENQLETCVAKDPNILGDRMLIILKQPLKEKFCDYFDADEFPQLSCQKHRIVLAAPRLDASAERIITYLSEQYAVPINAVFFNTLV